MDNPIITRCYQMTRPYDEHQTQPRARQLLRHGPDGKTIQGAIDPMKYNHCASLASLAPMARISTSQACTMAQEYVKLPKK